VEEEEEGGEVVVEVEETNLLKAVTLPEKDCGVKPLPNLGKSEGDGDPTEPAGDRSAEESFVGSEVAVDRHAVCSGSECEQRINAEETIVNGSKFLKSLLGIRLEIRENNKYTERVGNRRAKSQEVRNPAIKEYLSRSVRNLEAQTF
jgi:hypothetical protein